ncbi:hypothetical protein [Legionella yabuuchiae]|uniref:hypothetical protein n=1 Tax=Legionella yabuuchiae TaxID=376727 RepID=UPI0010557826|nr:hypothetical protein [Legionella yabuuchiae]
MEIDMHFKAKLPEVIPQGETIVLPVSMSQPLERGSRMAAIVHALRATGHHNKTTILICDYLNRFNCKSDEEALKQGDIYLLDHEELLDGFKIIRWKDFLNSRNTNELSSYMSLLEADSAKKSTFYQKMRKTWEKCLSTTQSLEASIKYQIEEYAAVLCMSEFNHLIYPKRITNGMAYLYNTYDGKKPEYHHIKVSEFKNKEASSIMSICSSSDKVKDRRHIHIAFRGLLENMETLLKSNELSAKSKEVFAEEVENTLMTFGLLKEKTHEAKEEV